MQAKPSPFRGAAGPTAAALLTALLSIPLEAATVATWNNAVSGNWTDASQWSTNPTYPNGNYDAVISPAGQAYTVTSNSDIHVHSLVISSPDATLDITGSEFEVGFGEGQNLGVIQVRAGAALVFQRAFDQTAGTIGGEGDVHFTGSVHTAGPGFSPAGVFVQSATLTINGSSTWERFTVHGGGMIDGAGDLTIQDFTAFSSHLKGTGKVIIPTDGMLSLMGGVLERNIENNGTGTLTGGANPGFKSATFDNKLGATLTATAFVRFGDGGGTNLLRNAGAMTFNAGGRIDVPFTNTGTVTINPGMVLIGHTSFQNQGTISLADIADPNNPSDQGGVLVLGTTMFQTFTTSQVGTINGPGKVILSGVLDNTASTLELGTARWRIQGTLKNGRVETGTYPLQVHGTLDGVTLATPVELRRGDVMEVKNGLTLDGAQIRLTDGQSSTPRIHFVDASSLLGSGEIVFDDATSASSVTGGVGPLSIGSGVTVRTGTGGGSVVVYTDPLTNSGTISGQTSGKTLQILATSLVNHGTLEAKSGGTLSVQAGTPNNHGTITLDQGTISISGGLVNEATGRIEGAGTLGLSFGGQLTNGGTVAPGLSPGTLSIQGSYLQNSTGTLSIELGGTAPGTGYDRLTVSSFALIGGTLDVSLIDGFLPQPADEFTILSAGFVFGNFSNVTGGKLTTDDGIFDVVTSSTSIKLANFVAVPEPASLLLITVGASLLLRRRPV